MSMIQINLFSSSYSKYRLPIVKAALKELSNIKLENKLKIRLVVCCNVENENEFTEILYSVAENGIEVSLAAMHSDEYIEKVKIINQSEDEYICKWDDDVYINRYVWDYMIENISVLDNPSVAIIAPTLSNGIPSANLFIQDFLTKEEISEVHSIFLRDNVISDIWGCNYESIYEEVRKMEIWDDEKYWKIVDTHNPIKNTQHSWNMYFAKGLHPGRFSYDYNMFLAKHAQHNMHKLIENSNFYLDTYKAPYFCNNLFIAKKQFYLESQKLFFDHWDEGQLTAYMNFIDKTPVYVRNCYGIHPAYGCTKNQKEIENYYIDNIFKKLC